MNQQTQQSVVIIGNDAKPQVTEDLLGIITELKGILQDSIKALSTQVN